MSKHLILGAIVLSLVCSGTWAHSDKDKPRERWKAQSEQEKAWSKSERESRKPDAEYEPKRAKAEREYQREARKDREGAQRKAASIERRWCAKTENIMRKWRVRTAKRRVSVCQTAFSRFVAEATSATSLMLDYFDVD